MVQLIGGVISEGTNNTITSNSVQSGIYSGSTNTITTGTNCNVIGSLTNTVTDCDNSSIINSTTCAIAGNDTDSSSIIALVNSTLSGGNGNTPNGDNWKSIRLVE